MRIPTLRMNLSDFYWVEQLTATSYAVPIKVKGNVMPTNLDGDIVALGKEFPDYLRLKQSINNDLLKIKSNDKIYWRKPLPSVHSVTQSTVDSANYIVSGNPIVTKNIIDIRFKVLQNR